MTSIGQSLAEARRQHKATIKDVEKAIKIRAKYISALEKNEFNQITGEAYVIAFLKTYAEWLGLDPKPLVDTYRVERRDDNGSAAPAHSAPGGRVGIKRKIAVGTAVAVIVAGLMLALKIIPNIWR